MCLVKVKVQGKVKTEIGFNDALWCFVNINAPHTLRVPKFKNMSVEQELKYLAKCSRKRRLTFVMLKMAILKLSGYIETFSYIKMAILKLF